MNLYKVKYRQWNGLFSDMYDCEKLSVGENDQEAIDRVKETADKDARNFEAEIITNVFEYKIKCDDNNSQKTNNDKVCKRIENQIKNDCQIIAEVDNEDNSIDVAVKVDEQPLVTFNIAADGDTITIRKWLGFGDSIDETINIEDIDDINQNTEITM